MQFNYYPLAIRQGKERQSIPGAYVLTSPRDAHRHRKDDLLAVLLEVRGEHRYEGEEIRELAEISAKVFFGSQGSVTRAMQQACEEINRLIMERNLDRGYEGIRANGSVCLAALHNGWLFICQFGPTSAILISTDKFEEYGKSEGAGESLGQSKRILPRFFQSQVKEGDLLLVNSRPPSTWSSYYLAGSSVLELDQLKRRLLNQVTDDLEAVVIIFADSNSKVVAGEWLSSEKQKPDDKADLTENLPQLDNEQSQSTEEPPLGDTAPIYMPPPAEEIHFHEENVESLSSPLEEELEDDAIPVVPGSMEQEYSATDDPMRGLSIKEPGEFIIKIARVWMRLRTFNSKLRMIYERIRKKILPSARPLQETSAPAFLVFLALIIPVSLVVVSIGAYSRIGRSEQYQAYMQQAQEAADLARIEKEPILQHGYWADTLALVISAEKYNVTQESRMLYEQAQFLLDEMDLATRMDFRPALTQFFPEGMVITNIQASSSGVYLLDKTSGSILRIFLNTKGFYEIDDEFKCQPGPYGLETVTNLVDFFTLPANLDNYRVMAMDASGNLLYCRPGEVPVSRTLAAPTNGWGRIAGIGFENNILYVLDSGNHAIWMYAGKNPNQPNVETSSGIVFAESPISFLDEETPDLGGALDLVINQLDVYILHQDGHMTTCRYGADKAVRLTECQDPTPFTDNRVGREDKKPWIFSDADFIALQAVRVPGASIFLLDSRNTSIYQFSYQLNLEHVLRPQYNRSYPLPDSQPSGFGVSPDQDLFLAFENKLFIAPVQ
ncbi:MAG: hypothetical protein FJZ98_07795 [Chloroflexi bacterium]|nr:hypothetical protein [Chloroflexota bacterium]